MRGPELPKWAKLNPRDADDWHPRTREWWATWRLSPQAATFSETDWDYLTDTARIHHAMWQSGDWKLAGELRQRVAKFGATPEDRMRLRMKFAEVEKAEPDAEAESTEPPTGHYDHLRAVGD